MPKTKTKNYKKKIHSFYLSSNVLIYSCPIPKSYITKGVNARVLAVEAQVTMKLSEYLKNTNGKHMEYAHAEKMIHCIGSQLKKLEEKEYGIPSFNLDDITVFFILKSKIQNKYGDSQSDNESDSQSDNDNDSQSDNGSDNDNENDNEKNIINNPKYDIYFAITNDDKVCRFDNKYRETNNESPSSFTVNPINDQQLIIDTPLNQEYITSTSFQKNKVFISPEFKKFTKTKELPYHIHFKSGYYSFGLLCIYCFLTKKNITFVREDTKSKTFKEIENCLLNKEDKEDKEDEPKSKSETLSINYVLQTIINTKIYWFLIRVLNRTPSERQYICV